MIVTSMTTEEIYKEIMRDFDSIHRRGKLEGVILQKEMLRKKIQVETRSVCYKTAFLNEWNIVFQMNTTGIKTSYYLKSNDSKGMTAYLIQFYNTGTAEADKFVVKYSGHFFERYNERVGLGLKERSKIVKHFFRNNFDSDLGQSDLLDGIRSIHFIYKEGMGFGWQSDAKKTIHMKTFVANSMLTKHQRSIAEHIQSGEENPHFRERIKLKNLQKAF